MTWRLSILCALSMLCWTAPAPARAAEEPLTLHLRSRVKPFKGADEWSTVEFDRAFVPAETALVICDMWDDHWCKSAAKRCARMAAQINSLAIAARGHGITVIHAPSDCMGFYQDTPQRKRALGAPAVALPKPLELSDPPLPVDDSDGGCDDVPPSKFSKAWTRQHPAIVIAENDFISDKGDEVYRIMHQRGIKNLLMCGVHTNMCVLNRSFAIKQMTRWGIRCALIRDLTDAMYNPAMRPEVSHENGTALVIEHIEKHWCPTVLSKDLMSGPAVARPGK